MMAMCFRSLPVRVQSAVSQFVSHRTDFGARNSVRFYVKSAPNGKGQTVKYGATKLSWPRHPHHRMPSSWPFTVAVTTPEEAHGIVAHLDDNGRSLLLEQLRKCEEEKTANAGNRAVIAIFGFIHKVDVQQARVIIVTRACCTVPWGAEPSIKYVTLFLLGMYRVQFFTG